MRCEYYPGVRTHHFRASGHDRARMAPKDCDRRYLAAVTEWGYQPSDVEQLVTGRPSE